MAVELHTFFLIFFKRTVPSTAEQTILEVKKNTFVTEHTLLLTNEDAQKGGKEGGPHLHPNPVRTPESRLHKPEMAAKFTAKCKLECAP